MRLLILMGLIFVCNLNLEAQFTSLEISTGRSYNNYQFSYGKGFNINSNILFDIINRPKLTWGIGFVLSNTYADNNYSGTDDRFDAYIGGLNYIDNPEGVTTKYFPIDNETYLLLKERGYINHFRPEENYFHNYYINGLLNIKLFTLGSLDYEVNFGPGIGIGHSSEQIANWTGFYGHGPQNHEEGTFILYKVERKTKHLYWNLNFSNKLYYNVTPNTSVLIKQTFSMTPGMLFKNNFFKATLTMVNVGVRMKIGE